MGNRQEDRSAARAALESPRATYWAVDTSADRAVAERVVGLSDAVPDALPGLLAVLETTTTTRDGGTLRYLRLAGTLADRLEAATDVGERLQLVPLFIQMCATLGHAHARGVSHGGVRPSTVAIADDDLVVLRDWDSASLTDTQGANADDRAAYLALLLGAADVRYVPGAAEALVHLAPEIVRGDVTRADARADVYALGVMLYRLLTGHVPYLFQNAEELLAKLAESGPPPATDVGDGAPVPLSDLAQRCMARRPADRPADANEVAQGVRAWLAHDLTSIDLALHHLAIQSTLGAARSYCGDAAGERLDAAVAGCRKLLERRPDDESSIALLAEAEALRDQVREKQRKSEETLHAARDDATTTRAELEHVKDELEHAQGELERGQAELDRFPARQEAAVHTALRAQRSRGARRTVLASLATAAAALLVAWLVYAVEDRSRVPDLVDLPLQAALNRLHEAGLRAELEYMDVPAGVHVGKVLGSTPSAGSNVAPASAVDVLVGRRAATPPPPAPRPAPRRRRIAAANEVLVLADMTGWTREKAEQQLLEAGYVPVVTLEPPPSPELLGKVLRQQPAPGTPLATAGSVQLFVGDGPPRTPRAVTWERGPPRPPAQGGGRCQQLDLWVDLAVPERVAVGEPFEVAVRAVNTSDFRLGNVTLAIREPADLERLDDTPLELQQPELEAGESFEIRAVFVATQRGVRRIAASAREERGWAAGGAVRQVVIGDSEDPPEPWAGGHLDLQIACFVDSPTVHVGDPFGAFARVTNTGEVPMSDVMLALRGGSGVRVVGKGDDLMVQIDALEPGASHEIRSRFISDGIGERRIDASARDERGWAAAGCFCGVVVTGLPALQLQMRDEGRQGKRRGVFEVGEEIVYDLRISNDRGTALTPDLVIVWAFPPELEFVSSVGEDGVAVSGSGQSARSASFVLAPDQELQFELVAKVIAAPPGHLVKVSASAQTTSGAELVTETESTTLVPIDPNGEPPAVPALQVELVDLDMEREEQGIFRVGEKFLYVLEVAGDHGTVGTSELEVVWTLPAELEFVSGAGDRSVTVTGSGQTARSSPFVLEAEGIQHIELVVKVIATPPRHLVQTRATVQTLDGSELATETESSTLRPGPPNPPDAEER